MNRLSDNLLVIIIGAVIGTASLIWLATSFPIVQAGLGLLVVLVFPGYALIELLMGRRTLGAAQHVFLTLSTSMAIAILGGLVLNQIPTGLRLNGWLAIFVSTVAGGGMLAWVLRHRRRSLTPTTHRVPIRIGQVLLVGVAILLSAKALTMARTPAPADQYAGYTILWMTPVQDGEDGQYQLGIDSKEFAPTQYKLELLVADQSAKEWKMIELAPNQQWRTKLLLNTEDFGQETLEANLYRLDKPNEVYRHVLVRPRMSVAQK